jgi:hypothetical protein
MATLPLLAMELAGKRFTKPLQKLGVILSEARVACEVEGSAFFLLRRVPKSLP